jgi:hypothetical protein
MSLLVFKITKVGYKFGMDSRTMLYLYIPTFIKIGSGIQI